MLKRVSVLCSAGKSTPAAGTENLNVVFFLVFIFFLLFLAKGIRHQCNSESPLIFNLGQKFQQIETPLQGIVSNLSDFGGLN